MEEARRRFSDAGISLDELGRRMGYEGDAARKSAWQFLNKTRDPRLSMLQRFSDAIGVSLRELFS